ncbi:MAG: choice-of-anchor tandem repeat NxxGxxAF-containing protein [Planctomycetota bacterium]
MFASIGLALHVEVHAEELALTTVALTGDAAPGTGDTFAGFIGSGALDAAGRVAFAARTTTGQGIWRQDPGLGKVAVTGDSAPGTAAAFAIFPGSPGLGDLGTAFFAGLTGGGQGVWKQGPGLAKVAVTGDAAPGTATSFSAFRVPAVNNLGHAAINGRLNGGGAGVWKESSVLSKVAVTGDSAPGTARAFTLLDDPPAINDSDHTAFKGTTLDGSGIWKESPALGKVAVAGDAAPGTSSTFFSFGNPALNDLDHTSFIGFLSTGPTGIWKENPTLGMVTAVGAAAPGTTKTFSGFRDAPFLNNSGHVAFFAELTGGDDGIWAEDRFGALSLVVRSGDDIEVRPGDFRTIRSLLVAGLQDRLRALQETWVHGSSSAAGRVAHVSRRG